jgi:hypothetical protein
MKKGKWQKPGEWESRELSISFISYGKTGKGILILVRAFEIRTGKISIKLLYRLTAKVVKAAFLSFNLK